VKEIPIHSISQAVTTPFTKGLRLRVEIVALSGKSLSQLRRLYPQQLAIRSFLSFNRLFDHLRQSGHIINVQVFGFNRQLVAIFILHLELQGRLAVDVALKHINQRDGETANAKRSDGDLPQCR
jgi:hypothetical protein